MYTQREKRHTQTHTHTHTHTHTWNSIYIHMSGRKIRSQGLGFRV